MNKIQGVKYETRKNGRMRVVDIAGVGKDTSTLLDDFYSSGGFTAKKLGIARNILKKMFDDKQATRILSFPAALLATGTRGTIVHLLKNRLVDVVITTCGALDHDIARSYGDYYHGAFELDDAALLKKDVYRLGNVLINKEDYNPALGRVMQPLLEEMYSMKKKWSTREICDFLGSRMEGKDESMLYWAHKNKIPIYIPGPTDGGAGYQLWSFHKKHKDFHLDLFGDEDELDRTIAKAKRAGALMIGGGISKHHVIWWSQFRDGLDYGVYITTAPEWDGSLSGAKLSEAVSWGKVKAEGDYITVEGEATILLPLLISSLKV